MFGQSFVPSLLLLFVELPWGLFCSILSPWLLVAPYPSIVPRLGFFLWRCSGLGLRCCGPFYGSCLLLGGSLSLVLVVLAWLLRRFRFVQVTSVSWNFLLGFLSLDFQCFASSSEWVETYVSVLSCLFFGCEFVRTVFCEQLLLASDERQAPLCNSCRVGLTIEHILTACPAFDSERRAASLHGRSMSEVLGNDCSIGGLMLFLRDTGFYHKF